MAMYGSGVSAGDCAALSEVATENWCLDLRGSHLGCPL